MSVSSEVQRTLVKSPPELWAELSDPATLARHLSELGEIRIVGIEPESAVEWEATAADGAQASGKVAIESSGWGTKVALSATRPVLAPEPLPIEPAPEASEPEPEPEPVVEPTPEPRRGFLARVFGRRTKVESVPEPVPESVSEPMPEPMPEPEPPAQEEYQPDLAAELAALEESLVAEMQAVLTAVLDRLGAAHHRPFSRS